jgi:hypothetical protein
MNCQIEKFGSISGSVASWTTSKGSAYIDNVIKALETGDRVFRVRVGFSCRVFLVLENQ